MNIFDRKRKDDNKSQDNVNQKRKGHLGCLTGSLLILLVFCVVGIVACSSVDTDTSQQATTNTTYLNVGERGTLRADNLETIFLATDEESYDDLNTALVANDTVGVTTLAEQGLVFGVSSGSKVLVIERNTFSRKVRIEEGVLSIDQDKIGLAGWVPMEWVVRQ